MPGTRVLYLQFANPGAYPPIAHGAHILAEAGADVWIVGTRPLIAGELQLAAHPRIRVTLVPEGERLAQKVAFARFIFTALLIAIRFRPTWLYASDLLAAPAALAVAAVTHAPVVYHEHDVHTESNPSLFVRLCEAARRRLAGVARVIVAPSPGRARYLEQTLGVGPVAVVMNCPRRADVQDTSTPARDVLRVVYQGTIVPQRLPFELADAVGAMQGRVLLTLAGYEPAGAGGHTAALITRVAAAGAPGAIEFAGLFTRRERLLAFCADHDVGLALVPRTGGDVNMQTMAGASNKAFDYLACGIPLIVSAIDDWRIMFVESGLARAVSPDDAESFRRAFEWCSAHREQLRTMGSAGRERIVNDWNYEAQFAPLRELLLARHGAAAADARTAA